jgi:hypothetical protein
MSTVSSEKQRAIIQEFIQDELLKRGFTAPIIEFKEEAHRFSFITEKFQTTPVLFKSICVSDFGSGIRDIDESYENCVVRSFWIQIHVNYQHFGGGSNGCTLFTLTGDLVDTMEVSSLKIS